MILQYQGQIRTEDSEESISNLLRKGWVEIHIPEYNQDTHEIRINEFGLIELVEIPTNIIKKINFDKKVSDGFLVQPENFVLGLGDNDRSSFSQMLSLVKEALDLGLIDDNTPQTIADKDGQKHEISTLRFRQIMVQYGFYYKNLWDQMT